MTLPTYVLITSARNEDKFIPKTLHSVVSQLHLPLKWVIVSDGSTDNTDNIVEHYAKKHSFIKLVKRRGDAHRNFRSQVDAINCGYESLTGLDYEYIGNLDADVSFSPTYYTILLERLAKRPHLGLAGGCIYEESEGTFIPRRGNSTSSVPHAVQLFRRSCFEKIGGYIPLKYGGPDWHAEVTARMYFWQVQSFTDLPVYHHKPTLTSEGILKGGFRQGKMDYSLGSSPLFEFFKCCARVCHRPYGLYAASRLLGFFSVYFSSEKIAVTYDFKKFLRHEQHDKIKAYFSTLFA